MSANLEFVFSQTIKDEFSFLREKFGYDFVQEDSWRYKFNKNTAKIVMEYDGKSFGCWFERNDLDKRSEFYGLGIINIAKYYGYQESNELFFTTREEALVREIKLTSHLMKRCCENFLNLDFSDWNKIVDYLTNSKD